MQRAITDNIIFRRLSGIQWMRLPYIPVIPMIILAIMFSFAVFAPCIAPYNPNEGDLYDQFIPLSWMEKGTRAHFLGTDYYGRDILSRLIYGARVSISVALLAISVSGFFGTILGLISGYSGGKVDAILMRVVDAVLSFPTILVAILLAAVIGPSYLNVILVITVLQLPRYARQIRGEVLAIKEQDFIGMAKVAGTSPLQIILKDIFPNVIPTLLVLATFQVGQVIIIEAVLSFLGVGVPPPTPSWGAMVSEGRDFIAIYWWLSALPGMAIFLTVLSINLVGDWVRDRLDPKLRQV